MSEKKTKFDEAKKRVEIKKKLFHDIYGLLVDDGDVALISVEEITVIATGAVELFKKTYL